MHLSPRDSTAFPAFACAGVGGDRWPVISALRLQNFRCFPALDLRLRDAAMTVFVGGNAQGKTSILEAACVLLRLQSPRTRSRGDFVRFGQERFGVAGDVGGGALKVVGTARGRELFVGGEPVETAGAYLAASGLVVWMGNEDLELVRGPGETRRRYLDFLCAQLSPGYLAALRGYEKALRSRNAALRAPRTDWRQVDAYGAVLIDRGERVRAGRVELFQSLGGVVAKAEGEVGGGMESLVLDYRPNVGRDEELGAVLESSRGDDLRRGLTLRGPHRDDFAIEINGGAAQKFASEGQQRTIVIALKLAQAALLRQRCGQAPVLLIDDVFGELDPVRRNALLRALPRDSQKLVTTTHLDWVDDDSRPEDLFTVSGAVVE